MPFQIGKGGRLLGAGPGMELVADLEAILTAILKTVTQKQCRGCCRIPIGSAQWCLGDLRADRGSPDCRNPKIMPKGVI